MDMGYRIEYGQTAVVKQIAEHKKKRFPAAVLCGVLLAGVLLFPQVREVLSDLLLPGDGAVTASALEGLADDLKEGETLEYAVRVFCQEIITGGA